MEVTNCCRSRWFAVEPAQDLGLVSHRGARVIAQGAKVIARAAKVIAAGARLKVPAAPLQTKSTYTAGPKGRSNKGSALGIVRAQRMGSPTLRKVLICSRKSS